MQLSTGLILIALGSAGLVILRHNWLALAALAAQWLGQVLVISQFAPGRGSGLSGSAASEGVTLVVCMLVLGYTIRGLQGKVQAREDREAPPFRQPRAARPAWFDPYHLLWTLAIVTLGGIAAIGFARIYQVGIGETYLVAFYWIAMSGALVSVLDGPRNYVKLTVGLLVLLNGMSLLVSLLGAFAPGPALLWMLSLSRVGMVAVAAYGLLLLRASFAGVPEPDLFTLFNSRAGVPQTGTALVVLDDAIPDAESEVEGEEAEISRVSGATESEEPPEMEGAAQVE